MKILKESKRLVEEEIINDVENTPVGELADVIQDDVEADGEKLNDQEAKQVAKEVKTLAQKLEDTSFATTNALVEALDECLDVALDESTPGWDNLLINGLPGSGKTAIIKQWGKRKNVKILFIDSKSRDLPTAMSGMPARDEQQRDKISMLQTTFLNPLDDLRKLDKYGNVLENEKPYIGVVLFLDELNRAKTDIRGSLLTLIQDHEVANGKNGAPRYFEHFLFTVAAVNPTAQGDIGINKLIGAEINRFPAQLKYDSTPEAAWNFFEQFFDTKIKYLLDDKNNPNFEKEYIRTVRQKAIAKKLLKSVQPVFKFDDREKDYPRVLRDEYNLLSQRSLTDALVKCDGTVASFIRRCERSNFLPEKMDLIRRILNGYVDPDVEIPADAAQKPKPESNQEDNPELFDGKINTSGGKDDIFKKSSDSVRAAVTDSMADWEV